MTQVKIVRPIVLFDRAECQEGFGKQKPIKPALDVFQAKGGISSLTPSATPLENSSFRQVSDKGPEYKTALDKLLTDSAFRDKLQSLLSKETDPEEKLRILEEQGFPRDFKTLQKVENTFSCLELKEHPLKNAPYRFTCSWW